MTRTRFLPYRQMNGYVLVDGVLCKVNEMGSSSPEPTPPEPLPPLPLMAIRLKFREGETPTFSKGTGTLVDATNNIWDLTYENTDWSDLLANQQNLLEVIECNTAGVVTNMINMFRGCTILTTISYMETSSVTTMYNMFKQCRKLISVPKFNTSNVTNMESMFSYCQSLTTVPLFDTSSVVNMKEMFINCGKLTTVPLFNTSNVTTMQQMLESCSKLTIVPLFDTTNVTNMASMFNGCGKVESGAVALYHQASTQANVPMHTNTFRNCGAGTETGAAELAQIPTSWGGTME